MDITKKDAKRFASEILTDPDIMYLSGSQRYQQISFRNIDPENLFLVRVNGICFEEEAPKKEALENVLSAVCVEGILFVFLIIGNKDDVGFYYGIARDMTCEKQVALDLYDICDKILASGIKGNFRGSMVEAVDTDDTRTIIETISDMKYAGLLEGVPGVNKDDEKYQSADRLADVMHGSNFAFMVIAKPLNLDMLLDMQKDIYLSLIHI